MTFRRKLKLMLRVFSVLVILPFWVFLFAILWIMEKLFGSRNKIDRNGLKTICLMQIEEWEKRETEELLSRDFPYQYNFDFEGVSLIGEIDLIKRYPGHAHLTFHVSGSDSALSLTQRIFSICAPVGSSFIIETPMEERDDE